MHARTHARTEMIKSYCHLKHSNTANFSIKLRTLFKFQIKSRCIWTQFIGICKGVQICTWGQICTRVQIAHMNMALDNRYFYLKGCVGLGDRTLITTIIYLSRVHMRDSHPGANLLPGVNLHPGANLHPIASRSYANKLCPYAPRFDSKLNTRY